MNVLATFRAISLAADVAKALELKKHLASLAALIRARKSKDPKAKSELEMMEDQIKILGETVDALLIQIRVVDEMSNRLAELEAWAALPWWRRLFHRPKHKPVNLALPASNQISQQSSSF